MARLQLNWARLILAAGIGSFALAFAIAAPVGLDPSTGTLTTKVAMAKHGADDGPGDDHGGRGRGTDDPAGHR